MKNKQYLVLLIGFLMLVMSFFLFKKNDSITTKKLKELNYDVTYREAFPDENLRRGIILCIMRNKCGEDDYNSGAYNYDKYYETIRKWPSTGEYFDKYYQALAYQTRPEYGEIIYDIEIEETKKINKADLEKIKVLISRDFTEDVTTLQGIEYLTNLKAVVLYNVKQENLDFSYNKFLEVLLVNVDDNHSTVQKTTKSLNLSQNTMLRELSVTLASEDSNLDYSNLNNLNTIVITESKIRSIILPNYVKKVDLAGNRITNIDLSHHSNLEYLRLQQNPISQIDIEHLNNLKLLNLHNTLITQNLDLSKNLVLDKLELDGNHISNLKIPNHITGGSVQTVKFKIKKNSYQELPLLLNDNKVYLNNSINFTRNGDKYVFNKLGTYNEQSINQIHGYTYHVNVQVEVEAGEEASFNPEIDQKDYMPILNEEITKEAIKKMITNLPDNIKDFEIVDPKPTIFNSNAKQKIRVRVTFSDDTFKEFDVPVNIYKVNYIPPTGRIIPNPVEVIEGKAVNISITRTYEKENYIDEVNLIKYVQDEIINYHHDNVPSGVVFNGNGYNGVINYIFTGTEEEHTFVISHSEDTKSGGPGWSDRIQVKLLRDTDGDGIPDIKDDDKDGDGYSNAVEIAKGSNPYNKNSTPDMTKKKQLDELVKDLEKLINNTKNNPFNNKNKLDVDNLKNNVLPDKENKKNDIKNSYTDSTSDTDLENLKQKVEKEIDNLKKEINKLRDKANFEELDKEKAKPIEEDIYTPESVKPLKDKIEEANKISRDTATQEDVDNMTKIIKYLRDKLVIDRTKLKNKIDELEKAIEENKCITEECKKTLEEAKELYTKTNITKEEILDMIKRIDLLLNKKIVFKNPKTGILSYSLVIIFIILISIFLIKQKKNYIR